MNRKKRFNKRSIVAILFFLSALIVPAGRAMAAVDNNPLCFTAKGGAVTVQFDIKASGYTIERKVNNEEWTEYVKVDGAYPLIDLNAGDKVYFRAATYPQTLVAYGAAESGNSSHFIFERVNNTTATVEASGNIMSLFTPDCSSWVLPVNAFAYMFYNCTLLTKAPLLPATTLDDGVQTNYANYCYAYMFAGCTGLTTAPELPATKLAHSCYEYMFMGCTSLVTPPELPATDLKNYCYEYMFQGCTSLTSVPELPAETLVTSCYKNMFDGCSTLVINSNSPGKEWKISAVDCSSSSVPALTDMFTNTGGTMNSTPLVNTTYYIASGTTKSTSATGNINWNDANNWTPAGIPGDADNVTISRSITIPDGVNAHCNKITISDNCTLTVSPTATLHADTITSNAASKLLIKSDANGTGTVRFANTSVANPKATVEMYLKGVSELDENQLIPEWQYRGFIGSPDAATLSNVVIYKWFETTNDTTCWHQHYDGYKSQSATGNFDPWTGYSMANLTGSAVTKSYITTLVPTSGGYTYTLSRTTDSTDTHRGSSTAPNCGVNLVTNSYSAPINLCDAGVSFTNAEKTVYFFNTRSRSEYGNSLKAAITTYPLELTIRYLRTYNPYIPAGQSFAVIVDDNATSGNLTIPASAVSTINSGAMYAPANKALPLIKITIDGDELYLVQLDNCSADFDNGYDGTKLFSTKAHQIYATNDYGKTAVNSDRTLLGQYIGFRPLVQTEQGWGRDGACSVSTVQMTISTRDLEGYEVLYLYDRVADSYTEITEDEVTYTFTSTGEENERRFQIVGKASDGTEYRPKAQPRIEVAGGEIWLMNFERTDAPVIVTDATGKTLWSVNAKEGTKFTLPDLPKGVYIVSCGKVSTKYVQ